MKGVWVLLLLVVLAFPVFALDIQGFAKMDSATVDVADFNRLKQQYRLDSAVLSRYESSIRFFENDDRKRQPLPSRVVFVGSSSIGAWASLAQDMDPMPVLNRGFGGSILEEQLFYFNRIFKSNRPQICVLYCENNIEGSSVQTIVDLIKYFEYLFHSSLPSSKLVVVSFKPSFYRAAYIPKMKQVNTLLNDYLNGRTNTAFVDVFTPMMRSETMPDSSIFVEDGLHMNARGYAIWTSVIRPVVLACYDSFNKRELLTVSALESNLANTMHIRCVEHFLHLEQLKKGAEVTVFHVNGLPVLHLVAGHSTEDIDVQSLQPGLYVLSVSSGNTCIRKKVFLNNQ